jgi:hypothetical protein
MWSKFFSSLVGARWGNRYTSVTRTTALYSVLGRPGKSGFVNNSEASVAA